jgi:hypothetical protein
MTIRMQRRVSWSALLLAILVPSLATFVVTLKATQVFINSTTNGCKYDVITYSASCSSWTDGTNHFCTTCDSNNQCPDQFSVKLDCGGGSKCTLDGIRTSDCPSACVSSFPGC